MEYSPIKFGQKLKTKYTRKAAMLSAIFFLGLFCFTNCKKKDDDFGLNVQPQSDALNVSVNDTTQLLTWTVLSDSVKTDEITGSSMLGSYVDPVFGKVQSQIFSHLRLESQIDFRPIGGDLDSIVLDSVVLYLALDGVYGNLDPQTIEVYQLAENIYNDSDYYSNTTTAIEATNLVEGNGLVTPGISGAGYVAGTLVEESILRVPLSLANFAQPIVNESGNGSLSGNDDPGQFVEWFKGLNIKVNNPGQSTNEGGICYVDLLSPNSKVTLFYRDTMGTDHDTIAFDFNFNSNCARYHSVDFDKSGTQIEASIADTTLGQFNYYLQALGGLKGKIAFPNLIDYVQGGKVLVNKAELVLPYQYFDSDPFIPSGQVYLTRRVGDTSDAFFTRGEFLIRWNR